MGTTPEPFDAAVSVELVGSDTALGRAARTLQLAILRPDGPIPDDAAPQPERLLIAATRGDRDVIGAVAVAPEAWPRPDLVLVPEPSWRLRSLAVAVDSRGRGVGGSLVRASCDVVRQRGASGIWAESRLAAVALYLRHGWIASGDAWDKVGAGPHRYVHRDLTTWR